MIDVAELKEYFSADEMKIAMGVFTGGFVTDLIAKTIYNAIFKPKAQAEGGNDKLKSLVIDILIKGFTGSVLYMMGKDNIFLRYMAIGSMVSVIQSVANYFLPSPTAVAEKASSYVAQLRPGIVVQTV